MDIIGKKNLLFLLSALVIVPGIVSFILFGLKLSIEFTGGSRMEYRITNNPSTSLRAGESRITNKTVEDIVKSQGVKTVSVQKSEDTYSIRTNTIGQKTFQKVTDAFKKSYKDVKELGFETVGSSIGNETKGNALTAVLFASIAITLYIAWAFRRVSKPVSSWKFGVCAVVALLHDILVVVGFFSILGKVLGVEVDSLFITALLTVMGFSVHDTIVVFDRIRENLRKSINVPFDRIVNNSILETLNRSLNTSLTVVLVLFTLLLFGGESIRWFVVALLVGIISGTYSSIFNASPLLVVWYEWDKKRMKK